jgi:aspartyl-tRNA synthetase
MIEGLLFALWKEALGVDLRGRYPDGRFPRMRFDDSMRLYGNDKPDLRFGMPHTDLTALVVEHAGGGVPMLTEIAEAYRKGEDRPRCPGAS